MYDSDTSTTNYCPPPKQHVHEITGSTLITKDCNVCHNHRFATVSDEAISCKGSHVHNVAFRTDYHDGHYHEFCGSSSPAIPVGDGRHVHFINACVAPADGHIHEFRAATLIENPIEK